MAGIKLRDTRARSQIVLIGDDGSESVIGTARMLESRRFDTGKKKEVVFEGRKELVDVFEWRDTAIDPSRREIEFRGVQTVAVLQAAVTAVSNHKHDYVHQGDDDEDEG